ncbi:MAG: hypothetical protein JWR80_4074 [Bradyrhizobium sp.]|nr:hypothetical protein [Bradyrhizobium sp.]
MARLDPSLRLARLVVLKDGKRAYDEHFHRGVNIIRGVPGKGNSVGKSTIADLIFYALGGDVTQWKHEAGLCDFVFAEVFLNGVTVTLRREISVSSQQPMWIYFGAFEESSAVGADGWQRYTYRRLMDRESFTQVLFRLMGMPEVPAEAEANITMHQLLRLMYVDQMTPVDRIFRFEAKDSALRRQAVGDLACGVFDERLYPAQLELRAKEKEFEAAAQQFNAMQRILSIGGEGMNLAIVGARQQALETEVGQTREALQNLKSRRFEAAPASSSVAGIEQTVQDQLASVNADLAEARTILSQTRYVAEDAEALIADITQSLVRMHEGEATAESIGNLDFQFCPSCFSAVDQMAPDGHCKLCKAENAAGEDASRLARMRNELELQLKESLHLQRARREEIFRISQDIELITAERDRLSAHFMDISRNYLTEADAEIDALNQKLGFLERQLVDLSRERRVAERLQSLSEDKDALNTRINHLKENISNLTKEREGRQAVAYSLVQSLTASIIGEDLHTEAEFSADSTIYFDFAEDRVSVNGKSGFSASSLTVLRNAFHLGLHWAACKDKRFRYPRFLLLDNIEDKGMTEERSQNFQSIILKISDSIDVDHQIIFTTSMISDDLDRSEMTVGEKYSFNNKSLKVGQSAKDRGQIESSNIFSLLTDHSMRNSVTEIETDSASVSQLSNQIQPLMISYRED